MFGLATVSNWKPPLNGWYLLIPIVSHPCKVVVGGRCSYYVNTHHLATSSFNKPSHHPGFNLHVFFWSEQWHILNTPPPLSSPYILRHHSCNNMYVSLQTGIILCSKILPCVGNKETKKAKLKEYKSCWELSPAPLASAVSALPLWPPAPDMLSRTTGSMCQE